MTTRLLLAALVLALVLLAVGGWTVKGLRRLARAGAPRLPFRPALAR